MVTICYNCDISYGENRYERCPRCGYLTINPPEKKEEVHPSLSPMETIPPHSDHEGLMRTGEANLNRVIVPEPVIGVPAKTVEEDFAKNNLTPRETIPDSYSKGAAKLIAELDKDSPPPKKFPIWGTVVDVALTAVVIVLLVKLFLALVP